MAKNYKTNESEYGLMNIKIDSKIKVKCFELDYKGDGIARYNDIVVFIKGLLKDEEAIVKINKITKRFATAEIVEITKKATSRKSNVHHLSALDLFHLNEDEQIKWQIDNTIETFKKIAKIELNDKNNIISNNNYLEYRNKNVFHVLKGDYLKLGLYNNSYELIQVDNFELCTQVANAALSYINKFNFKLKHLKDNLKHIIFRTNQANELMIVVVLKEKSEIKELINMLSKIINVESIYINISKSNKHILGDKSYLVYGKKYLNENYGSLQLPFDDQSFLQINTDIAIKVYEKIKTYVDPNEVVIDSYSGVGGIGLFIQDKVSKVYLLENNLSAINISKKIIEDNNYTNVEVVPGDVYVSITELEGTTLIVDPPRKGLDEKFIETILNKDFGKIIYLSCNIKTQARDVLMLNEKYEILNFQPIKMFYQTTAIENLIVLKKRV